MIVVACLDCSLLIRVLPDGEAGTHVLSYLVGTESEFWPDKYPCPSCGRHVRGMAEEVANLSVQQVLTLRDLTPNEAFAAFSGAGFPDEQQCSLECLQALLAAQPVRRVVGRNVVGLPRAIVDRLELADGSVVHFGAAPEGAVVYRISRAFSYAHKMLEEHANSDT